MDDLKHKGGIQWIDVAWTFYPRMVALSLPLPPSRFAHCEHGRALDEPCVACEGLSILYRTRR